MGGTTKKRRKFCKVQGISVPGGSWKSLTLVRLKSHFISGSVPFPSDEDTNSNSYCVTESSRLTTIQGLIGLVISKSDMSVARD